jgi:hypothetical protein
VIKALPDFLVYQVLLSFDIRIVHDYMWVTVKFCKKYPQVPWRSE